MQRYIEQHIHVYSGVCAYAFRFPIHLELLEPAEAVSPIPPPEAYKVPTSFLRKSILITLYTEYALTNCTVCVYVFRFPIHLELLEPAEAVALIPPPEAYKVPANVGWCSDQGWDIKKVRPWRITTVSLLFQLATK
jgi:hypothetical protein